MKQSIDTIVTARRVISMAGIEAEAIAIAQGRVAALGPRAQMLALRTASTELVELGESVVLPGLVEPHTHPDLCAQCYAWVDVSGFTHASVGGVERALREAVARTPKGQWIFAFGLDFMLTPDLGVWDRARLDALVPNNPIFVLIQSMHTAFVNSAALHAAGIDEATPDPSAGGRYVRDGAGRLTGKIEESPAMTAFVLALDWSPQAWASRMRDQFERYARAGITTLGMPGMFVPAPYLDVYESVSHEAPVRTAAYLRLEQVATSRWRPGEGSDRFRIRGAKLWYDGSPYSGTMLLDDPYLASELCCCRLGIAAGSAGYAMQDRATLVPQLRELLASGWQVLTHAQGDRAVRETLDVYEEVLGPRGGELDHRWRVEHVGLISQADIERARRLGVAFSFHVNHVHYYGPELRDQILGAERAERMMPVGSAVRAGHRVSLHADSPMFPPAPLGLVCTAATRRTRRGEPLGAGEAISLEQALRAVTIDAAWQLRLDDEIGSLVPGKRADFTIVGADPYEVAPETLGSIEVRGTWLDGRPAL
ncbi:MAG: amidohydrolase [Deltaproteobacteria bacterium]|nr:amidohydrolase [Deltaproteobacteria bacterium]